MDKLQADKLTEIKAEYARVEEMYIKYPVMRDKYDQAHGWIGYLLQLVAEMKSEMDLIKEDLFYEKRAAEENHTKYVEQYHRNQKLITALEFYADEENYIAKIMTTEWGPCIAIDEDGGKRAREALTQV